MTGFTGWRPGSGRSWPLGTSPSWVARPNLFTFPALVLVVDLCERFHRGAIPARKTLWLLPIFLLWTNLHGGFLAGILVLVVTYLVECSTAVLASDPECRGAAARVRWWTVLGVGLFAATLVNPYGFGLHLWNLRMLRDPFIQTRSTPRSGCRRTSTIPGWFRIEMLRASVPDAGGPESPSGQRTGIGFGGGLPALRSDVLAVRAALGAW